MLEEDPAFLVQPQDWQTISWFVSLYYHQSSRSHNNFQFATNNEHIKTKESANISAPTGGAEKFLFDVYGPGVDLLPASWWFHPTSAKFYGFECPDRGSVHFFKRDYAKKMGRQILSPEMLDHDQPMFYFARNDLGALGAIVSL